MSERYRKISPFAAAFAAEYKGFMKANGISNLQIAKKLDRNDGYVSERANGKRPLDTEDVESTRDARRRLDRQGTHARARAPHA